MAVPELLRGVHPRARLPERGEQRPGERLRRVRSHCRLRKTGTDYISEYDIKWMSSLAQSHNATEPYTRRVDQAPQHHPAVLVKVCDLRVRDLANR